MTKRSRVILAIVVVATFSLSAQPRSPAPMGIQGVWQVVEQTINDRTLVGDSLGPGFHIDTAGYYAVVRDTGNVPRPRDIDTDTPTAAQLQAMWGPFVAQFGTYEVSGDRLTERTLVSKDPRNMGDSAPSFRRFRLEGNTLITEPYAKGEGRFVRLKMIRVE